MNLIESLKNECIIVKSTAPDKDAILHEIAAVAAKCHALSGVSQETILHGLKKREELGSTGFQNGVAIPHCLLPDVDDFVIGIITHKTGVDFKSLDGKPTFIIAFIIGPQNRRNDHIRLLSTISRVLNNKTASQELLAAAHQTPLRESFLRHVCDIFTKEKVSKRNLVIVTVQNEALFSDILRLFSEADNSFLSVIDAQNSSEHLYNLPLFAAFWNENKKGFHRIIVASIVHTLTNEMLRRIDTLVGGLKKQKGVLVQVLDALYTEGSLDL